MRTIGFSGLLLGLGLASLGCAGAVESSKLEDGARREVPVAICLKSLERHGAGGVVSTLTPDDYWSLILPSYDASAKTVDLSSPDCAGRPVLASPDLMGSEGPRTGAIAVTPADIQETPGPAGFKVVWLRTHKFPGGSAGGPLALMRPKEGHAEVYAIGVYRGSAEKTRFSIERMGPRILVTAGDEGCAGVKPNQSCETLLSVFMMSAGQLVPGARIPLDRIEYGTAPGVAGTVQYRLTATPVFSEKGIRVVEQVVVRDSTQVTIRKSNLDRTFTLKSGGKLVASNDSLWEQVAGGAQQAKAPEAVPPAVPAAPPPPPPPAPKR